MSRWEVRREWRDTLESYSWVAIWPSGLSGDVFFTWREAMAYADRMARTREVVLPHNPLPISIGKRTIKQTSPHVVSIFRRSGSTAADIHRKYWKPLALALLALAEQEEHE